MPVYVTTNISIPRLPSPRFNPDKVSDWVEARLIEAENHIKRQLSRMGTGPHHGGGAWRRHQRSLPGEYPLNDTHMLYDSIYHEMTEWNEGELKSDLFYSLYLTKGTSTVLPRKMLADALQDVLNERPEKDRLAQAVEMLEEEL